MGTSSRSPRVRTVISRQVHRALQPSSVRLGRRVAPTSPVPLAEPLPIRARDIIRLTSPWSLGKVPRHRAVDAVATAREVFSRHPGAVDAVLGWLFSRFDEFGAIGDDMVAHHAMLRDERYYQGWVTLCSRLKLFERDR